MSRSIRSPRLGIGAALLAASLGLGVLPARASADLPPAAPNLQLIPAGSLVIPMDSTKQNLGGTPFNLRAYGLVTQLLWNEIPVRWAIRAGKSKDQPDFTAVAGRVFPSTSADTATTFSAGPFIVLARDASAAMPIISGFAGNVAVYKLSADTTVDVRYTLLHKPKVAVLDDGGNAPIHRAVLDAAGFVSGVQYAEISATTLTTINANSCFTIATEPHFDAGPGGGAGDPQAQAIRAFASSGGNFLAQCIAALSYENNAGFGHFQSTAGIVENNSNNASYSYPSADFSFSQFDGPLKNAGGSVNDFELAPSSNFRNGAHAHVANAPQPGLYVATAAKLGPSTGGMVFYLGGHSYGDNTLDDVNGLRMYLNAVLTPTLRPPPCGLDFTETPGEIHGRVLEDLDGNGDLSDGVPRAGVTVRLYVDGGDGVPSGADDSLTGTTTTDAAGSYGFVGLGSASAYWVAVDSKTISPSAGLNATFTAADAWPEETYGPAGAHCDDGALGTSTLLVPGPCFGGKSRSISDAPTILGTSEHVALATPGTSGRRVDFGFSFVTIVSTRDGDDDGPAGPRTIQGSLRQFLLNANAVTGVQRSMFRLRGGAEPGGWWRIMPTLALPVVTDAALLDGATQTGFAGPPLVELDGSQGRAGLIVTSGGSTIRSLAVNRFNGAGITFDVNGGNRLEGCYVGTDVAGASPLPNGDVGVLVGSNGNTIGGTTPAARNVISGNARAGLKIDNGATGNVVQGNYIGTSADGTAGLGNNDVGIDVRGPGNTIGGTVAGAGNLVSDNRRGGIRLSGANAGNNTMQGNLIGTNAAGDAALGNAGPGIDLRSGSNTVGGTTAPARNVIAANTTGINMAGNTASDNVIQGNFIGTDATGSAAMGNTQDGIAIDTASNNTVGGTATGAGNVIANSGTAGISVTRQPIGNALRGNSIHDNGALGIDLAGDDVTPNDNGDSDIGPNDFQNFPVLTSVTALGTTTTITGTLNSTPGATFALDFFASNALDPSGYGEGQRYLGSTSVVTDGSGNNSFTAVLAASIGGGEVATATATAPDNSTSEFSRAFTFVELSGTVVEDVNGDGDLADAVGRPSVTVRLYQDGGDGLPTGTDDVLYGTTTTDATGAYRFPSVLSGTFWAAVDSKTVTASAGLNSGASASDLWPEETHAAAGALCDDGAGGVATLASPGACYGGRRSAVSDNAASLATSEHVARIAVVATGISGVDFAFGFAVVVNTRDGDDDLTAPRTIQGSFRQLVQNGNAVAGPASSVFHIPRSDLGYDGTGNGEYTIVPVSAIPDIADPLGVDASTQPGWSARPIVALDGRSAGNAANGLRVTGGNTTIRSLVIKRFRLNGIELSGAGGDQVRGCYIGTTVTGTAADANSGHGVDVLSGNQTIGGTSASDTNLISGNGSSGIHLSGAAATGNTVLGNLVGTNAAGNLAVRNSLYGIELAAGATANRIGSSAAGARNVFSGNNSHGIHITGPGTSANIVEGNYVGTTAAGAAALPNANDGIVIDLGASGNTIGGTTAASRNVVSGNNANGIKIDGTGTSGNVVQGNFVGVNAAGSAALANGAVGVLIANAASTTTVGGAAPGAGNVVSGNGDNGVEISGNTPATGNVVQGNFIGTDATGAVAIGNARVGVEIATGTQNQIGGAAPGAGNTVAWNGRQGVVVNGNASACSVRQNSIHDNALLGIDLKSTGITLNDLNDVDVGPNDLQNFPVLGSVTTGGGTTIVTGTLNSTASSSFTLEFFASPAADPLGYGEGATYLGTSAVTTDGAGNASFSASLAASVPVGHVVTSTATSAAGKTSEFSAGRVVTALVDLSLFKVVSNTAPVVGGTVVFTVTAANAAASANATGIQVTDVLPAGYTYVADDASTTGTSFAPASGIWTVGNLVAGSSVALRITVLVNVSGPYLNTAEVTACAQSDIDSTPGDGSGDDHASVATTPVQAIDLSLAKTVDVVTPTVGGNVVFTVSVSNAPGTGSATGVVVRDLLPAGYAYVADDSAATGTTYDPATGLWSVGPVASGSSRALQLTARVLGSGSWQNVAEVVAAVEPDADSTPGDGAGDDFASASTTPIGPIDLSLTKTVDDVAPSIGSQVAFTLTLTNAAGFADATAVAVTDLLPSGYAYVSDNGPSTGTTYDAPTGLWTIGSVPSGASVTLSITARVNSVGTYVNAAQVTAAGQPDVDSTPGDGQGDDFATTATTPGARVDLSLTKTVDVAVPPVGSNVVFTLTVANAAGLNAATGVAVTDLLPSGYAYVGDDSASTATTFAPATGVWTVGGIPIGANVSLKLTAKVLGTGSHVNAAEVTAADQPDVDSVPGDGAGDDFATASTTPSLPTIDLSLTKIVNNTTPSVGSTVVFTLHVANAGGFSNASGVVVTDRLPTGYAYVSDDAAGAGTSYDPASGAWTVGSLAGGASAILHVSATVLSTGSRLNTAEVTAAGEPDIDSVPGDAMGDDYASALTTPGATIDLSLTKSVDNANPAVGTNVVFTVTVTNAAGLSDATGVAVTDLLPAGYQYAGDDSATTGTTYAATSGVWTVGNVAAGASVVLKITATVLPNGPYLNRVEVTAAGASDIDSTPQDGTGDDYAEVSVAPVAVIDLSLAKTVDNPSPPVGGSIVFTLTVSNAVGAGNATGVAVTDLLPAGCGYVSDDSGTTGTTYDPATGIWHVGNVASGASVSLKIRATVLPSGPWPNHAEVTAAAQHDVDSTPGDGAGDDHVAVDVEATPLVDLSLTKSVDVLSPAVGANVVFTVTVANAAGMSDATGVVVADLLPSGYSYVSDDSGSTGTSYDAATGVWNVGSVLAGASIALHLTATVLPSGSYENGAEVTAGAEPDRDSLPGNGVLAGEDDGATSAVAPLGTDGVVDITDTSLPGETLSVMVADADLNLDPGVAETVQVTAVNGTTAESELVTLMETGPASGVFHGTVGTVFGTSAGTTNDGVFSVQAGNAVAVTYPDDRTAAGGKATRTDTGTVIGGVSGTLDLTSRIVPGDALSLTVADADLDTNPTVVETVQVAIVNDATDETETVTLTETGPNTGIFSGTMATSASGTASPNGDGTLYTRIGDTLTAAYEDARTAAGGTAEVTAASSVGGVAVRLTKTAAKHLASIGDVVPYAITVSSTLPITGVSVQDLIPAGFKFVENSARLRRAGPDGRLGTMDDLIGPIATSGVRPVVFGPFDLVGGESAEISYALRAGSGAGQGNHENVAEPFQGGISAGASATATVTIVADPVFDQSTIVGKVFEDRNRNDWQDAGEDGVAQAMVVLDDGTYVLTDAYGRFHFPATNPGQRMVKLNLSSLPPGAEPAGEESRILWITPGVPVRVDFGVVLPPPTEKTIGAPGERGVQVSGALQPTPIEVRGNISDVTVLVNDTLVPLSTSDVKLEVKPLDEIIQLVGNALPQPVTFRLHAQASSPVESWSLDIFDPSERTVKTISGEGTLPDSVPWDATTTAGELVSAGQVYQYQLSLRYVDGTSSQSSKRIFGVNRETVLSVELTGDAFVTGNADLTAGARKTLDRAAAILAEYPREKVVIEGHTDSVGRSESNLELSKKRAEAARDYLVRERGVSTERLTLKWLGEERPKASNDLAEGRAVNRRVEIKGEVQRVEGADLNAHIRAEPFVYINKSRVPLADSGRFAASVPAGELKDLEVEMANGQGRTVFQRVELPDLKLELPQGEILAKTGAPEGRCVRSPDGIVCRIQGVTEAGNSILVDGKPVPVAADGSFASELSVGAGKSSYPVIVRNLSGVSRGANLVLSLDDRDGTGSPVVVSQAVPNLTLRLPPDGSRLPGRKLQIEGTTEPGNQVTANGQSLEVAADGRIHGSIDMAVGHSAVVVEVKDPDGGTGRIESTYEVPKNELFLLALADGQFGKMSGKGQIAAAGNDQADDYYTEGRVAFYLKGVIAGKYLITSSFDSDRQSNGTVFKDLNGTEGSRLLTNLDPDRYYPVYGDDSTLVYDVESQGKFYLALDSDTMSAVVGDYPLAFKDTELAAYQRTLYGARYAYRSLARTKYGDPDTSVIVFGAQVRQAHVRDELRATGGSLYYLSHQAIVEGSEQVTLVVRDKNTRLLKSQEPQRQNIDYTIKYPEGRVMFLRPVASVAQSGSITDQSILSGDPVYIQVDYEAAAEGFEKTAAGARVRQHVGDHVAVAGTYVKDELQGGSYELGGLDTEVKLGASTRIVAEYAKSAGADSLANQSEDGGLSYTPVAVNGTEEGSALKVAAEVDVGEWFHKPDRYHVRMYYKDLEPGFFSSGNFQEQGTTKLGVNADLALTGKDSLRVRYDQEERTGSGVNVPGATKDTNLASLQWEHRATRWGTTVELFQNALKDVQGSSLGDSSLAAARGWMKLTEKLTGRADLQYTIDGPANDQATADLQYQVLPALALEGKGTVGSRGNSAEAGAVLTMGETNVYLTERTATDQAGNRTATVLGARSPLGAASRIYTEYQWEDTDTGKNAISLVGLQRQWDLGPGFRFVLSGENAHVKSSVANTSGTTERDRSALAASVTYEKPETWSVLSRNEIRFDGGPAPTQPNPPSQGKQRQILTFNQFSYKLNADLSLLGKLAYSTTEATSSGDTVAKLDERSLGVAYRPVANDRFSALGRYTRLQEVRAVGTGAVNALDRTMNVLSAETIFRITPKVEWAAKLAARMQEEMLAGLGSIETDTLLTIQRFNLNVWRPFDLGLEYRILRQRQTDDQRQGWLGELMWKPVKYFRVGLGYNFTDFSDNEFSANDYSQSGWFVRVQGRY